MKINSKHPYVIAWHFILLLSVVLAFYVWPQEIMTHRLKGFFSVLIVMLIGFVHIVFVFEKDSFKSKQSLLEFEIKIPGWIRLLWEVSLYTAAVWIYSKWIANNEIANIFVPFYSAAIASLYLLSWDRTWLMIRSVYPGK